MNRVSVTSMLNFIFCQNLNVKSSRGTNSLYCDYSNFNADSYIYELRKVDLANMTNAENDPNEKFNVFHFISFHFIIFIQVKGSYIYMFFNLTCFKR